MQPFAPHLRQRLLKTFRILPLEGLNAWKPTVSTEEDGPFASNTLECDTFLTVYRDKEKLSELPWEIWGRYFASMRTPVQVESLCRAEQAKIREMMLTSSGPPGEQRYVYSGCLGVQPNQVRRARKRD